MVLVKTYTREVKYIDSVMVGGKAVTRTITVRDSLIDILDEDGNVTRKTKTGTEVIAPLLTEKSARAVAAWVANGIGVRKFPKLVWKKPRQKK